jgi:hypothetical protein
MSFCSCGYVNQTFVNQKILVHRLYKFFFRFTFFQNSHISREPMNLGSHIIHAAFFEDFITRSFIPRSDHFDQDLIRFELKIL